jgi:hypothetical protein
MEAFRVLGYSEACGAARSGFSAVFQNLVFFERLERPFLEPQNQSLGRLITRGILERLQARV